MPENSNPLRDYFRNNRKRVVHKWEHYFDIYHRYFSRYRATDCVVVEIGVGQGGSLQMWKAYFGEKARIYGIDINPECKAFEEDQIEILIGSQADRAFLALLKEKLPRIDILIDDGGHYMEEQIITFEEMYPHLSPVGIYLCEDVCTSYWEAYGGGFQKPGTFIEYSKQLVDRLNAAHALNKPELYDAFTESTLAVHFYNSVVVFEKQPAKPLIATQSGEGKIWEEEGITEEDEAVLAMKLRLLGIKVPKGYDMRMLVQHEGLLRGLTDPLDQATEFPKEGETMIGIKRLNNVAYCVKEVVRNDIPGDLIETGVWRGGSCIFMRYLLQLAGDTERTVWVADSFAGLPPPDTAQYPLDEGLNLHELPELAISLEQVQDNFRKYGLLDGQVRFLKGWFKDTLPGAPIEKLAVLRLDGDLYESTIDALYNLYPKLSVGGFCIIDDWGAIASCRLAVAHYRQLFGIEERIQVIDWTGTFWKKEKDIPHMDKQTFMKQLTQIANA